MSKWLEAVGEHTKGFRESRARRYETLAGEREAELRAAGHTETAAREGCRWYYERARGQRERPERVIACGESEVWIECSACGCCTSKPGRCRSTLLCVSCRSAVGAQKRVRFLAARKRHLEAYGHLADRIRGYRRWSEKFVTLTAPHPATDTVLLRIERVVVAFPYFLKQLNAWLSERHAHVACAWFRVHEWTSGSDGLGHPHIHLWFFGPYLPKDSLDDWWRNALNSTGTIALAATDSAHTFITNPESQGQVAQELIKYLTKDIDAGGRKLAPELYAQVYAAYSLRRATQSSRGFMAGTDGPGKACLKCGDTSPPKVHPPAKAASLRRQQLIEELGAHLIDAAGAELSAADRARAYDELFYVGARGAR